jgi:hypothetical protein
MPSACRKEYSYIIYAVLTRQSDGAIITPKHVAKHKEKIAGAGSSAVSSCKH